MAQVRRGLLEVKGAPIRHPDQDRVKTLVELILSESRRKVSEWSVEMMEYDFYSSTYSAKLGLDGNFAVAKLPTEWIDEIIHDNTKFNRKKIKRLLKDAVEKFYELEEE